MVAKSIETCRNQMRCRSAVKKVCCGRDESLHEASVGAHVYVNMSKGCQSGRITQPMDGIAQQLSPVYLELQRHHEIAASTEVK